MYNFAGRTALVTGAASGIGLEIAKAFAECGAIVTLVDRDESGGEQALQIVKQLGSDKASFMRADLSSEDDLIRLYQAVSEYVKNDHRQLDIVVNNAGIDGGLGNIENQSTANIDKVLAVNVRGTMLSVREAVRVMKPQGQGVIVNLASIAGHVGFAGSSVYTASKHAILGLTKAVALENARSGIRVCAVSPGAVDTDMTNRFTGRNEANKKAMLESIPLGRMCTPREIARGVLFMACDDAALLIGQTLNLDGGWANVKA